MIYKFKSQFAFFALLISAFISSAQDKSSNDLASGLIVKTSTLDFNTTYEKTKTNIEANPNLKIILELDHSKNAASVDLDLRPTRIILFGNPKIGTVLMKDNQSVSIDLPQKIIVFESESGEVKIAYNDPYYLKSRHELKDHKVLEKVSQVLDKMTEVD
ncbi:DUF302 domain-containing protein [Ekhidna sp.]